MWRLERMTSRPPRLRPPGVGKRRVGQFVAFGMIAVTIGAGTVQSDDASRQAEQDAAWRSYTENVRDALGIFPNIPVYEKTPERWARVAGRYLPITVDGKVPDTYTPHMLSDRPMILPANFDPDWDGYQGQSMPYGVVGRMAGSNPEVQWVFLSRHYRIKDPVANRDPVGDRESFAELRDIAVIGHHPRTGATAFFQYYNPKKPKMAATIVSPFRDGGQAFWNDVPWMAGIDCAMCHSADPFIHTPWINQAKTDLQPGAPFPEPMVPSNPFGPYYFIPAELNGENLLADWDQHLVQLDSPTNTCTSCHRVARQDSDLIKLYTRSTLNAGQADYWPDPEEFERNPAAGAGYQTDDYRTLPWMPPASPVPGDFYSAQPRDLDVYREYHGADAAEVIAFAVDQKRKTPPPTCDSAVCAAIPAPPPEHRRILVPRDQRDAIAAQRPLVVVDTRMRANTQAALEAWRFHAGALDDPNARAAPVILRRIWTGDGRLNFRVIFVGKARGTESAQTWMPVADQGDWAIAQGDYLALLLINKDQSERAGIVPYSMDSWAVPSRMAADIAAEQIATYRLALDKVPTVGDLVSVRDDGTYSTYSFEFRSRM